MFYIVLLVICSPTFSSLSLPLVSRWRPILSHSNHIVVGCCLLLVVVFGFLVVVVVVETVATVGVLHPASSLVASGEQEPSTVTCKHVEWQCAWHVDTHDFATSHCQLLLTKNSEIWTPIATEDHFYLNCFARLVMQRHQCRFRVELRHVELQFRSSCPATIPWTMLIDGFKSHSILHLRAFEYISIIFNPFSGFLRLSVSHGLSACAS